ncbi:hypothetical protein [Shewanella sp. NIFS-20-20]|uniref:hypothetical protein n=1 Tax=Shewanella sp. NIFS-20-20 TaxID=2853806 RepID=UPI001C4842BF|nr:hypothetical protein [Shewanella sp. NIFS-20-20]MBV7314296.1 hypothetical protein [Shewanella sp. NIFS-20-20]
MCNCKAQAAILDISHFHSEFTAKLTLLARGDWLLLMRCPEYQQLYTLDEWDKYL